VILSGLNSDEGTDLRGNVAGWVEKPAQENVLVRAIESAATGPGRRPLVLVVEDDADLAGVITASFEHHHLEVVVASTGREAVWLAQELVPDLVVLDLHLPDAEGFSVVDSLREDRRLNRVPLVVYTASELDASARAKLRLGQTIYLTKSRVTPEEFENRVMDLLRRVTAERRTAEVSA
jgi:DNA-binding response OmpR family regulator